MSETLGRWERKEFEKRVLELQSERDELRDLDHAQPGEIGDDFFRHQFHEYRIIRDGICWPRGFRVALCSDV